jgi:hypothetical protein
MWIIFPLVLLFDIVFGSLLGIAYDPSGWERLILPAAVVPLAIFYTLVRFDPRLSSILNATAFLILVTPLLVFYTYVTAALGAGAVLCDPVFDRLDRMMGFDWRSYLQLADHLVGSYPSIGRTATALYGSFPVQLIAVIVLLSARGQYRRLQTFCFAFVVSLLIVGAVAGVFPAVGTYDFYRIDASMHPNLDLTVKNTPVEQYLSLRNKTFTTFSLARAEGIISFPSFHTTLAILFIWGMWQIPGVRWIALAANIGMMAATPLHGSHYFVDVIAGAAVAPLALALVATLRQRSGTWLNRRPSDQAPVSAPSGA